MVTDVIVVVGVAANADAGARMIEKSIAPTAIAKTPKNRLLVSVVVSNVLDVISNWLFMIF